MAFRIRGQVYVLVKRQDLTPSRYVVEKANDPEDIANAPSLDMTLEEVHRLVDGSALTRGQAAAALSPVRRQVIFGPCPPRPGGVRAHEGTYRLGVHLRRIGLRMPPSQGCGRCVDFDEACDGCARRIANEVLIREPFDVLLAVVKYHTPQEQVKKAHNIRLQRMAQHGKLKAVRTAKPKETGT